MGRVGVACRWRGWGLNAPLGGPAAMVPVESGKNASWTMVCYCSVHHGDQMAPGGMEPLASVSHSSAGGETLKERARLNGCLQIEFPEAYLGGGSSPVSCFQALLRKPCIQEAII